MQWGIAQCDQVMYKTVNIENSKTWCVAERSAEVSELASSQHQPGVLCNTHGEMGDIVN